MVPSLQVVISCGCVGHTCGGCTSPWWDSGPGYPRNIRLGHMASFLIICTFKQICFVFVLQSIYMTFQNIQYILCPFPHNFTLTVRYINKGHSTILHHNLSWSLQRNPFLLASGRICVGARTTWGTEEGVQTSGFKYYLLLFNTEEGLYTQG